MAGPQQLRSRALRANLIFAIVLAGLILLPAWSLAYWQGLLLWAHFCAWCLGLTLYFLKHDPALAERRMEVGSKAEELASQKWIQAFNSVFITALFVLSAFDGGAGWSRMPPAGIVAGHALVALGFLIIAITLRQNSFAAATVTVAEDQRIISTGLYGRVRHPMYAGALVLFIGIPLALGSWWGLVLVPPLLLGLVMRLTDEERHLAAHLKGYADYRSRVRFRLVPGIW
ncbi:MAG: methyltransferase family protein [Pseudomonadota bacterium]